MVSDRVAAALARMNAAGGDGSRQQDEQAHGHRIRLSPSQVVSSSLAASCSALVASFPGVAGTIAGAAIGSVVATTGTAVYGHALRKGGKRIVRSLGPDAVATDETEPETETRTRLGTALTPEADGLARAIERAESTGPSPSSPKTGHRKSIALAAAMLAVFGAAITIGLLAGGPIRQAGTGYNFTRAQPVTQTHSATPSAASTVSSTATTTTSPTPSTSTSAVPSSTAPTPASGTAATTSQTAASQSPTG